MDGQNNLKEHFILVKDIALMAIMVALIFTQEQVLVFIPNFNFTHLFIAVAFYLLGLPKTLIVVVCYSLLDNIFMGSFNLFYTPCMIVSWMLFPVMLFIGQKLFPSSLRLVPAILGCIHALLYSWAFVFVSVVLYSVPFWSYWIIDIYWEVALCVTAFLTIFLLLPRIITVVNRFKRP